jgi:hypothetical protein
MKQATVVCLAGKNRTKAGISNTSIYDALATYWRNSSLLTIAI